MAVAVMALAMAAPGVAVAAGGPERVEPGGSGGSGGDAGSWIVTFHDEHPARALAAATARQYGGTVGHVYEHVLNGSNFRGSAEAASNLTRDPRVRTVVADRVVEVTAETVSTSIRRVRARHANGEVTTAHGSGYDGAGARIATLDTGIDLAHPGLAANLDTDRGRNGIDASALPDDVQGRGTHVGDPAALDLGEVEVGSTGQASTTLINDGVARGYWR